MRRMRWEKLAQSCQTIIAWIFLFFVVGTFLALVIMKVTAEESLFYLVLTTIVFLILFPLFVIYPLSLFASFLSSSLLVTHSPPSMHTTHTHGIDSGSSQLSFKARQLTWWHCSRQSLCVYLSTRPEHNQTLQHNSLPNTSRQPQWMVSKWSNILCEDKKLALTGSQALGPWLYLPVLYH